MQSWDCPKITWSTLPLAYWMEFMVGKPFRIDAKFANDDVYCESKYIFINMHDLD